MNTILHILFIISVIAAMLITLPFAILFYMITGHNVIQEMQIEASKFERKYFNNDK